MSGPVGRTGIPFVVSGPSGVGKSSLLRHVLELDPRVRFSVSHTTRKPRKGEKEGREYFFVDEARFRQLVEEDVFLEWAEYQGNQYGTSRAAVPRRLLCWHSAVLIRLQVGCRTGNSFKQKWAKPTSTGDFSTGSIP